MINHTEMLQNTFLINLAIDKIFKNTYNNVIDIWRCVVHVNKSKIPEDIAKNMVIAIQEAVCDDILEDIAKSKIQTKNSIPARIWDLINRNLIKLLNTQDCSVGKASRGPWEMLVVFEKHTQYVVTFMREKRFSDLVKAQRKRKNMHYLDMLTKHFNSDLTSPYEQLSIISHEFDDENKMQEKIQILLSDLRGNAEIVRHHILVLFDTIGFELVNVRAVMLTPALEIAYEEDWSNHIDKRESLVVSTVDNIESPYNNPNRGLKLKGRAIEKQKKNRPKHKQRKDENKEQA